MCQIGHGQPPVAFPSSQPDRKASSYGSQTQQQQPTASQSACEFYELFHSLQQNLFNLLIPVSFHFHTLLVVVYHFCVSAMLTVL